MLNYMTGIEPVLSHKECRGIRTPVKYSEVATHRLRPLGYTPIK